MPKLRRWAELPRPFAVAVLASGPPAAAIGLPRGRPRAYAVFLAQMWAYLRAFELTYAQPEKLRRRVRVDYPIELDRRIGGGAVPTARLQSWSRSSRLGGAVELALGAVYACWAVERHLALLERLLS